MRFAHSIYIGFFVLMVVVGHYFSVLTLKNYDFKNSQEVLRGKAAVQLEDYYNQNFIVKDIGTHVWALINYVVFKEGRLGVVIGDGQWLFTQEEFKDVESASLNLTTNLDQIAKVKNVLDQHNITLIMALIPAKADIYREFTNDRPRAPVQRAVYSTAISHFQKNNLKVVDLKAPLLQAKESSNVFLKSDTHWSVAGASVAAQTLAQSIEESRLLTALHSKDFKIVEGKEEIYKGDLLNFVPLGPFFSWFAVSEDQLRRASAVLAESQEEVKADDLFADEATELVLVGTSYSANLTWNFAGAISHFLGIDLLNVAQEGKGPFLPMVDYLNSKAFTDTPPRVIVWEIPERFLPVAYDHAGLNQVFAKSF